jgi:hypothetical protein
LDRDFRSEAKCKAIIEDLEETCDFAIIHGCKEIENFVLVPDVIDRLIDSKVEDRQARGASLPHYVPSASHVLFEFAEQRKTYLMSQFTERYNAFVRASGGREHEASIMQAAMEAFEKRWKDPMERLRILPGKEAISHLNSVIQSKYKISVTPSSIVEMMRVDEITEEMRALILMISQFSNKNVSN